MNLCPKCISLCTLCVLHHLVSATTGGFAEGKKTQFNPYTPKLGQNPTRSDLLSPQSELIRYDRILAQFRPRE